MRRGRGDTDRHAGPIVQARIEDRCGGGIEAQRPRDLDGRPIEGGLIEDGRGMFPDLPPAFNPDVARAR